MNENNYKPKPGDMEIRILKDGKVMMVVPDEELMEIARGMDPTNETLPPIEESQGD